MSGRSQPVTPGKCRRCGKPVPEHERPSPRDAATFGLYCDACLRTGQLWLAAPTKEGAQ